MSDEASAGEDGAVKIIPPVAPQVITLMNHRLAGVRPHQTVERIYWALPLSTFTGVTDSVRTILVELVAEMRSGLTGGEVLPSKELADQAVSFAVYGDRNRVVINQAGPGAVAVAAGGAAGNGPAPEGRPKRVAWWIFGVVATAGAVATIVALFH